MLSPKTHKFSPLSIDSDDRLLLHANQNLKFISIEIHGILFLTFFDFVIKHSFS